MFVRNEEKCVMNSQWIRYQAVAGSEELQVSFSLLLDITDHETLGVRNLKVHRWSSINCIMMTQEDVGLSLGPAIQFLQECKNSDDSKLLAGVNIRVSAWLSVLVLWWTAQRVSSLHSCLAAIRSSTLPHWTDWGGYRRWMSAMGTHVKTYDKHFGVHCWKLFKKAI